jgi:phosphoenolpyruvate-protein phosphotransferase
MAGRMPELSCKDGEGAHAVAAYAERSMQPSTDPTSGTVLQGVAGAPGLACGPLYRWAREPLRLVRQEGQDPAAERARLEGAVAQACAQIEQLERQVAAGGHAAEAGVFGAHLQLVRDRALHRQAGAALEAGSNAEAAWSDAVEAYAGRLAALPDPAFALRAADLRDVGERVLRILLGLPAAPAAPAQPSVIVARDLTPSETVSLDPATILAFCTAEGGPTSHTAILAKALGLPAVVALGEAVLAIPPGTALWVDGARGQVTIAPDPAAQAALAEAGTSAADLARTELAAAQGPAVTRDGRAVAVAANVGGVEDARAAVARGAEGVGLFRTEFLFLNRAAGPGEDEQASLYGQVLAVMGRRPVIIRTLDAGGDKELPYLGRPPEANPFLGVRAIRLCLAQPDLFRCQLRALLRAGAGRDLGIMFPMVATLDELRRARALVDQARRELRERGCAQCERPRVGIMVEIPAAALTADLLAREADFFSIGTNDLTQYALAADRTNPRLAHLNDPCHPAVLRLVAATVQGAKAAGIPVGVCGEMAGDPEALPLLVGLGIDELSMSPALIPRAKALVRRISAERCKELSTAALDLDSAAAVRRLVRNGLEGLA